MLVTVGHWTVMPDLAAAATVAIIHEAIYFTLQPRITGAALIYTCSYLVTASYS